MISAMSILPLMDVCAKFLSQSGIPIAQIVWARMFFGATLILIAAWRYFDRSMFTLSKTGLHTIRAVLLIGSTGLFFSALNFMPIADTLAIFFVQPLITTVLAPLLLREHVDRRRWIVVGIGFVGTLIVIRPGFQIFNIGIVFALASGTAMAFYVLMTRRLARVESSISMSLHTSLVGAILASIPLPFVWESPSASQWGLLILVGAIAVLGHFLITWAYSLSEASLLAPLAYSEMIMATLAGWWFFGELPDRLTFLGVSILVICAIYISRDQSNSTQVTQS
jgi:drug/metabolite transporter (DMT)-like permease